MRVPKLIALLLLAVSAQVQQAGLDGNVTDASGAPLPGVTIELRNAATNYARRNQRCGRPLSRPAGYGRNSLRLPATAMLNLRIVKFVPVKPHGRVDFVIEAFNLLNRRNVTQIGIDRGVDPMPATTFGAATRIGDARQVQGSLDLEF